jgi:hypothetical protein
MHGSKTGPTLEALWQWLLDRFSQRSTITPRVKNFFPRIIPCPDFVPIAERRWLAHFVADADSALNQRLLRLRRNLLPPRLSLNRR